MPQTLSKPDALSRLNSIQATSAKPLSRVNSGAEVLRLTREVHHEVGLKQQAAAVLAEAKESQYSAALNGAGVNYALTWLYAQDDAFLLRWIEKVMEHRGLTPENRQAVRAFRIVELVRLLTETA